MQSLDVTEISRQGSFIVGLVIACALAFLSISFPCTEIAERLG